MAEPEDALRYAAKNGHIPLLRKMLSFSSVDVMAKDHLGCSAFTYALDSCISGQAGLSRQALKLMIRNPRVDVNATSTFESQTALDVVCWHKDASDLEVLLQRPELDINYKNSANAYALTYVLYDMIVIDQRLTHNPVSIGQVLEVVSMMVSDPRISLEHARQGLVAFCVDSCLPAANVILDREQARLESDRVRLAMLRRQSEAGLLVPEEIVKFDLHQYLGSQKVITQETFDAVAEFSYSEFQNEGIVPRPTVAYKRVVDLLTTFLEEYGNVDDFDIPTVYK